MGKAGLIVAGTRHCKDREIVEYLIQLVIDDTLARFSDCTIECIIEGGARGVDTYAKEYAHNIGIEVAEFVADWHPNGSSYCDKSAGYKRNVKMHQYLKNFDVRVCFVFGMVKVEAPLRISNYQKIMMNCCGYMITYTRSLYITGMNY